MEERIEYLVIAQKAKVRTKNENYDSIEMSFLKEKVKIFSFVRYPWGLWFPGLMCLIVGIIFNYFIYFHSIREQ